MACELLTEELWAGARAERSMAKVEIAPSAGPHLGGAGGGVAVE